MVKVCFEGRLQIQLTELAHRVKDAMDSAIYKLKPKDEAGDPEAVIIQVLTTFDDRNASVNICEQD